MQPKLDQRDERVNQFFYVFAMSAFPSGELLVFETHPINSVLHGNGYGIIVSSASEYGILEWVMQHLQNANVSHSSIPPIYGDCKSSKEWVSQILVISYFQIFTNIFQRFQVIWVLLGSWVLVFQYASFSLHHRFILFFTVSFIIKSMEQPWVLLQLLSLLTSSWAFTNLSGY